MLDQRNGANSVVWNRLEATAGYAKQKIASFGSCDRLFPNQDIMPEGGFGNLITLPLQYHVRREGNSIFVDANLSPLPGTVGVSVAARALGYFM